MCATFVNKYSKALTWHTLNFFSVNLKHSPFTVVDCIKSSLNSGAKIYDLSSKLFVVDALKKMFLLFWHKQCYFSVMPGDI